MGLMKSLTSVCALVALVSFLPGTSSNPYVISDDRVRSLDITPVLGRGYSIMTNSYQSTCLMVDETTTPSYNYDCKCCVWMDIVSKVKTKHDVCRTGMT